MRTESRARSVLGALAALAALLATVPAGPAGAADELGTVGPSYHGATAPTADKPQSKLWYADGQWWGSLFDPASGDFHIFGYEWAQDRWVDTGILVDERVGAYTDTLWDGKKLYIAAAGSKPALSSHGPVLMRFSYDSGARTWSRDPGFPVTIASGGVEAALIEKDSTGLLWMTFTKNNKVMLTHSLPGDDRSWVTPYELPSPAGESRVDPDDISAVVAYDGDKIGVLWSNQVTQVIYWASHQDGTGDQAWAVEAAYAQPEGADDHLNLKSVAGDDSGRVFVVAKTSMDKATDPLINLLALRPNGDWQTTRVYAKGDNVTRAIVQIDTANRKVYVFASSPCCAGGDIYYKSASLTDLVFPTGKGTLFMHRHDHPKINNPTSSKQTVTPATGLLVLAGDDSTRTYVHHRIELPPRPEPPSDTRPPETTITSGPPAATAATDATFTFTSDEADSTFRCALDGEPPVPCISPWTLSELSVGAHQVLIAATDPAGNTDPTPALHAWTVTPPAEALFYDDFSSGAFSQGKWVVQTGGDGTAAVVPGAVRPGDMGAQLTSTTNTGSTASIRATLPEARRSLTLTFDALINKDHSGQSVALTKLYSPGGAGARVLTLQRVGKSGMLQVQDAGQTPVDTGISLPLNSARHVTVRLVEPSTVVLTMNGTSSWSTNAATLGSVQRILLGENSLRRSFDLRFDSVVVTP